MIDAGYPAGVGGMRRVRRREGRARELARRREKLETCRKTERQTNGTAPPG